jgi:hypothetical protein
MSGFKKGEKKESGEGVHCMFYFYQIICVIFLPSINGTISITVCLSKQLSC